MICGKPIYRTSFVNYAYKLESSKVDAYRYCCCYSHFQQAKEKLGIVQVNKLDTNDLLLKALGVTKYSLVVKHVLCVYENGYETKYAIPEFEEYIEQGYAAKFDSFDGIVYVVTMKGIHYLETKYGIKIEIDKSDRY